MLVCPQKQQVTISLKGRGKRTNQSFEVQVHLHGHRAGYTEQRRHQDELHTLVHTAIAFSHPPTAQTSSHHPLSPCTETILCWPLPESAASFNITPPSSAAKDKSASLPPDLGFLSLSGGRSPVERSDKEYAKENP